MYSRMSFAFQAPVCKTYKTKPPYGTVRARKKRAPSFVRTEYWNGMEPVRFKKFVTGNQAFVAVKEVSTMFERLARLSTSDCRMLFGESATPAKRIGICS